MTRIKKKLQKLTWREMLAEILRYGFFVFYVIFLGGLVAGARWTSNYPKTLDQQIEAEMKRRLAEIEKQRAEETLAEKQRLETEAAASSTPEPAPSPFQQGIENAPA